MKKKKYLYYVVLIFAAAKYKTLTCNDFIACSTAQAVNSEVVNSETINLQAVVEENSMIYVKLSSEAVIEEADVEVNEAVTEKADVEASETVTEQADVEVSETVIEQADVEVSEAVTEQADMVVENPEPDYADYDTPPDNSFKSYMDYRTITDTTSMQYELQKQADTDGYGMRMVDDRYCVAVGSYYSTTVGQAVDIIMQNGNIIHCIVADLKQDIHTDSTNRQNPNGSIVEFLVDTDVLHGQIQKTGDISYFDTVWQVNLFSGEIDTVRVYE
ncbi:MAG: hypothetical protein K2N61_12680 [Lachnospiraceae bacterium]|nr:hypothetical protein [Lachnospiraceae bacterium]